MYIRGLKLVNFRNYESLTVDFNDKLNVVLGDNGQGKSNLLEGIYLLSMGKSFRTSKDVEMIRFGADFLRAEGNFIKGDDELSIEVMMNRFEKRFKINGLSSSKNADLLENAYIVVFSPEDLRVVKDEPEKRRKFMDRELFLIKPMYYKDLSKYKKSISQRNAILKDEIPDEAMLDVWDENVVLFGLRVMRERKQFINKLKAVSSDIHASISGGKERLELEYESNIDLSEDLDIQRDNFERSLKFAREKDLQRKTTTRGPHRDDISIFINGIDVRHFGSQGQQRTAALSLKLAELRIIKEETGEDAVILLDDVLSELDRGRQSFLIDSLSDNQVFISAAEMSDEVKGVFSYGKFFKVDDGII